MDIQFIGHEAIFKKQLSTPPKRQPICTLILPNYAPYSGAPGYSFSTINTCPFAADTQAQKSTLFPQCSTQLMTIRDMFYLFYVVVSVSDVQQSSSS